MVILQVVRADKVVLALAEEAAGFMYLIAAGRQSMAELHGECPEEDMEKYQN